MIAKIVNLALAALFAVFAVVQLNDPDPLVWVIIYGTVAAICGFAAFNRYSIPVLIISMIICAAGALYLSPGVYDWFANHTSDEIFERMSPDKVFIETARECFGLLVTLLVLAVQFTRARKAGTDKPRARAGVQ